MDINYQLEKFKPEIQKIVRDYVFDLDAKLHENDSNKYDFHKEYDYVKIHDLVRYPDHIYVTYQICDLKTKKVKYFEEPVSLKFDILLMIISIYKALNAKIAR